jgi:hypothetical protein
VHWVAIFDVSETTTATILMSFPVPSLPFFLFNREATLKLVMSDVPFNEKCSDTDVSIAAVLLSLSHLQPDPAHPLRCQPTANTSEQTDSTDPGIVPPPIAIRKKPKSHQLMMCENELLCTRKRLKDMLCAKPRGRYRRKREPPTLFNTLKVTIRNLNKEIAALNGIM